MRPYLRFPDVRDQLVVVVAADDVWAVRTDGGRAWRLTDDATPVRNPRISPDGTLVAFASTRDGHPEAYVVPVDGGDPRRLTWWGSPTTAVLGWTPEGRVLVASAARGPSLRTTVPAAVDPETLEVAPLPWGPVGGVALRPDGAVVVSTAASRPPSWWKRYRGGTAAQLWLDGAGDGGWTRLLPDVPAGLVDPGWVGDQLVFVSDLAAELPGAPAEVADLYALDVSAPGARPRRITRHTAAEGYVRDARTDGRQVVFTAHGTLHLLPGLDGEAAPVDVVLPGQPRGRRSRLLDPTADLTALRPDHTAATQLVEWHGKAFALTTRQGPARALLADSGVRARLVRPLGATGTAVLVDDADGDDALRVVSTSGQAEPRRLTTGPLGRVLHLEPDAAGARVAVLSSDGSVRVVDVADGATRLVGRSRLGEPVDPAFSRDGRWLVWAQPSRAWGPTGLVLADLSGGAAEPVPLTAGRFADTAPVFTRDGRHLVFLSARTLDPVYDAVQFDLSFAPAVRPVLVPLRATEVPPFGPAVDGRPLAAPSTDEAPQAPAVEVDVDGFEDRLVPFPVPSGTYRDLHAVTGGVVWVRETAPETTLRAARAGVEGEDPETPLEFFSFARRRAVGLADRADAVTVSGDGERLVVRRKDQVVVRPAGRTAEDDDPERVEVDLDRLRFELDPVAEWHQMYDETVRLMRDHFWRADLDGVDLAAVAARYRPLVARLGSRDDLVDLLWEVVGELNTSHAYVQPTDEGPHADRRIGLLGADLSRTDEGWRIDAVLPGESSDPAARSPLRAAGVGARVGDLVLAVDGRPVDQLAGPAAALAGTADTPVELLLRPADGGLDRRVVVVPLASEEPLRYQAWVRGRSAYVREHSGGRLGYVHVPDMMSAGWAQLHRELHEAVQAEGLVVDVRRNRGGHTSQLVLDLIGRRVVGWSTGRHVDGAESYPLSAVRGPVVLVTDRHAGSDGDIVSAGARAMGVGPVVGERTWGGVIGIDGRFSLVDGTAVTQPRYSFWLAGQGWGVENHGVDPDVEVVHSPADHHGTADPQLDRAIAEALDRLAEHPAAVPPDLPPARAGR
ncbi:tricorn protease [Klenkia soli]|uniref:Tricorn protease homolog n=1 Tax=Klenkia soli TaxID=1052260 RepID=A0A1H0CXS1_9ACTN|nr:S41 family peptidase [Klenkia soli]SDN62702.1 tricorn protease [Klenkia soli]